MALPNFAIHVTHLAVLCACLLVAPAYPSNIYFADPIQGRDLPHRGGYNTPVQTIQHCVDLLEKPGDECRLKAGRYYPHGTVVVRGKHGTAAAPIVIRSAGDGPVIIDGTAPIKSTWEKYNNDNNGGGGHIYVTTPGMDVWQLFGDNHDMMVPARSYFVYLK